MWKTLKKLGLPTKKEGQAKICLGKEGDISFDPKANAKTFKYFYSNLALNEGYSDLIGKVNSIIDEISPVKEMCVKIT